jgi:hypothetical protein
MSIEGVIFDVSGTLLDRRGQPAAGVVEALQRIRGLGVQVVAAHNDGPRASVEQQLTRAGIAVDHIITRNEVAGRTAKGSPLWIARIRQDTGLETNQLLYVGDSDQDMITASHSKVVYFHAAWSVPEHRYGLAAPAPGYIAAVVQHIFRKQHPWAWRVERLSQSGTRLRQMALIDGNGAGDAQLKDDLVATLKSQGDRRVGAMLLREFVILHLVASIYAEGLQNEADIWSIYPSRDGTRASSLAQSLETAAKLFRDKYRPDLLVRSAPAVHSREAFYAGGQRLAAAIDNQLKTIIVNPLMRSEVSGKTVLMLDDFLTRGATMGVARCLLRAAGATEMVAVTVGKYGARTHLFGPPPATSWDPSTPAPFAGAECPSVEVTEGFNQAALDEFVASHRAMQTEQW